MVSGLLFQVISYQTQIFNSIPFLSQMSLLYIKVKPKIRLTTLLGKMTNHFAAVPVYVTFLWLLVIGISRQFGRKSPLRISSHAFPFSFSFFLFFFVFFFFFCRDKDARLHREI